MVNAPRNQLTPVEPRGTIGVVGNVPHQGPDSLFNLGPYELAIVEFNDQGCCHDRAQMSRLSEKLDEYSQRDAVIIVFVHGWKHDARSDDENLRNFTDVLQQVVGAEEEQARAQSGKPRPVLGIFIGWRGMSFYDRYGIVDNLTFWDRQDAGRRVSVGSVRELLGRLRHYRDKRKAAGGAPLLIIVGHSFGGMIVYSALAQSLIEAAATPSDEIVPAFADLVLLVNPAIEAARYLPIHALVDGSAKGKHDQPPVFVCATARNDWATRFAFPAGNAYTLLTESYKDARERQAMLSTIGHVHWLKTHDLSVQGGNTVLSPTANGGTTPFWVVQATPSVIDGHNGIFKEPFLEFLRNLLFKHMNYTRSRAARVQA